MKITKLECIPYTKPSPGPQRGAVPNKANQRPLPPAPRGVLLKMYTDEGIIGYGDAGMASLGYAGDTVESILDPHQGIPDVAGYRVYRSGLYPFGPWKLIAEIAVGDPHYFQPDSQQYVVIDTLVALGYAYYYSITSFDNGHSAWAIDPAYTVPPLESSLYANRLKNPFYTTLLPQNNLNEVVVVPNPFYRSSGFEFAGDTKLIQFINLQERCTIRIYTIRGDLVKTLVHEDPQSGIAFWNQISDNGQYVKSGMYFYVVTNEKGETIKGKLAIIN